MFDFFKNSKPRELETIPKHIGIIMDGNGRWAKKRMQPRVFGHKAGMDALQDITLMSSNIGVKVLTVYAFSTENWSRPEDEVSFIMKLPVDFFDKYVPKLHENNVKIQVMGERDRLPKETLKALEDACQLTKNNTGLILNFALNYGGRAELTKAMKEISEKVSQGILTTEDITEKVISDHLMTSELPEIYRNPDLIIRTSGEIRLSNFLPWQSAYSEFYFTPVFWPDFNQEEFTKALEEYSHRQRRFGKV
ncbi:isoprenyl transferase [Streptococcus pacificus]|uniref:Isoprenyl transferase n=1 Tax=Streptococcus pacificus TaxID=2740577 RepID=A0ABS0ZKB2_9STRE|nr:isoprenyl transferase [Streptococcus pacificus]MBJ8326437.1 isoprenyl transferase [Streptococcus pacificus]